MNCDLVLDGRSGESTYIKTVTESDAGLRRSPRHSFEFRQLDLLRHGQVLKKFRRAAQCSW